MIANTTLPHTDRPLKGCNVGESIRNYQPKTKQTASSSVKNRVVISAIVNAMK